MSKLGNEDGIARRKDDMRKRGADEKKKNMNNGIERMVSKEKCLWKYLQTLIFMISHNIS